MSSISDAVVDTRALLLLFAISIVLARLIVFDLFVVRGHSMFPTLVPGDVVLIFKAPLVFSRLLHRPLRSDFLQQGAIYVFLDPTQKNTKLIKRCQNVMLNSISMFMVGDNPMESGDSRHFGPVCGAKLCGKAILVLLPPRKIDRDAA